MKKVKVITALSILCIAFSSFILLQNQNSPEPQAQGETIKWHSFQEAAALSKKEKKKIFIDVYTSWCGWCKVMDKNTFTHPVIAAYMNKHFYAVKLDAEMKDTIVFNNYTFVNPSPNIPRSTHQLASSLLSNKLSYPTTVYLDENFNLLTQVPGYLQPIQLEPIMKYFGESAYTSTKWEDYQKTFKGEIQPAPANTGVTPPSPH